MTIKEFATKYGIKYNTAYSAMATRNALTYNVKNMDYDEHFLFENIHAFFAERKENFTRKAQIYGDLINRIESRSGK